MKVVAIVVFLIEVFLSHQGGKESGAESRWLSERIGLKESFLRSAAHVLFFAVLTYVTVLGFGWIGVAPIAAWAAVDELTKPLLHNQRHCSGRDVLLNYAGVAIGGGLATCFFLYICSF